MAFAPGAGAASGCGGGTTKGLHFAWGEAEDLIAPLRAALRTHLSSDHVALPPRFVAIKRPHLKLVPPPCYDLLDIGAYHAIGV